MIVLKTKKKHSSNMVGRIDAATYPVWSQEKGFPQRYTP
jgi:hypothetical protein